MFDEKSRYKDLPPYQVKDHRGRTVSVIPIPAAPNQSVLGYHLLKQGQRIDHLAAGYLKDPAGFWRIAEINDAMLTEALSESKEVAIPEKLN